MSDTLVNDIDPIETQDWLSAVDSLIRAEGAELAPVSYTHLKHECCIEFYALEFAFCDFYRLAAGS